MLIESTASAVSTTIRGRFDPERVYDALIGDDTDSFWLDGGPRARSYFGRGAPIDAAPSPMAVLDQELSESALSSDVSDVPFRFGLIGWLPYEGGESPSADMRGALLRVNRSVMLDARGATVSALAEEQAGEVLDWVEEVAERLGGLADLPPLAPPPILQTARPRWRDTEERYLEMIAACTRAIRDGDAYVLCLTTSATVDGDFDPFQLYRRLRAPSLAHRGALIRVGGVSLVSASPERFLTIDRSGRVVTRPIKGTRPRGKSFVDDLRLADELRSSEKERAENLMIVDLVRNDLSRVCELGSVQVTKLFDVESHPRVHQLVSTVEGQLIEGTRPSDVLRACFPAGSMTGAPKQRAMELLEEIESGPRGIYSGAFGYFDLGGAIELAMTIRTVVLTAARATLGTGGGITALSDPDDEIRELAIKAAPLLRALGCESAGFHDDRPQSVKVTTPRAARSAGHTVVTR